MIHLPFKYGIVSEVKPGFAKVYFQDDDGIVTDWWPVLQKTSLKDKESWPLNVKEHVVCLCDERLEEGVVLGAIYSDADKPDAGAGAGKFRKVFEDGTTIEYDKNNHKLTADIKGDVDIKAALSIVAEATTTLTAKATVSATVEAPVITLKGNVTVVGVISAGGLSLAPVPGASGADGKVSGNIETSGDIIAGGEVKAGTVSLSTHVHTSAAPGSPTSPPTP